jgi:hypothetical protein
LAAKKLGFHYLDRDILKRAAEYLEDDEADLSEREEKLSTFMEKLSRAYCPEVLRRYICSPRPALCTTENFMKPIRNHQRNSSKKIMQWLSGPADSKF